MNKWSVSFLLILSIALVYGFLVLDKGLSGGSATNPIFAYIFIAIAVLLVLLILTGVVVETGLFLSSLFAFSPIMLTIGAFVYTQYKWDTRPEQIELNAKIKNVRCALKKMTISEIDKKHIYPRVGMMETGPLSYDLSLEYIETNLKVTILPDCQFKRRPDVWDLN